MGSSSLAMVEELPLSIRNVSTDQTDHDIDHLDHLDPNRTIMVGQFLRCNG